MKVINFLVLGVLVDQLHEKVGALHRTCRAGELQRMCELTAQCRETLESLERELLTKTIELVASDTPCDGEEANP